jgi:hypothetical protein
VCVPIDSAAAPPDLDGVHAAESLADALAAIGLPCTVEARARLAIVRAGEPAAGQLADAAIRGHVIALGRERGFTHVALAVGED